MDLEDVIIVAPGVKRGEAFQSHYFEGTKEALLASGLVRAEWFPTLEERDKRGRVRRTRKSEHEGREVSCMQTSPRRFRIYVGYSIEDQEKISQRRAYERALNEEKRELSFMPSSHEHYRAQQVRLFEAVEAEGILRSIGKNEYHGYSYADDVIAEVSEKLEEIRGILEAGRTTFSRERHEARISQVRAKTAEANPGFREFLNRLTQKT